jgi:hypothetical protein
VQGRRFFPILNAPLHKAKMGNERRVICLVTGHTFDTLSQAAAFAGAALSSMHCRLKDGRPCGRQGYRFAYTLRPVTAHAPALACRSA